MNKEALERQVSKSSRIYVVSHLGIVSIKVKSFEVARTMILRRCVRGSYDLISSLKPPDGSLGAFSRKIVAEQSLMGDPAIIPEVFKHLLNAILVSIQGGSLGSHIDGEYSTLEFLKDLSFISA